jgi:hypothetical protein
VKPIRFGKLSPRAKKIAFAIGGAALVVIVAVVLLLTFRFVTPDQGITTNLGSGKGHTVLIQKVGPFAAEDLVVAALPGSGDGGQQELIIGTVFSLNDQTYALYDGQVIWQIPLGDIIGKVLFAQAIESVN